ncbi:YecH family metal-binding protein [Vibrio taketomensis]|uniref:YecH family metal-binding protein n=1 Tax=Vibrio taketomensis TaxID=2572923 RepID=UPI00138A478C|nr:YecH family metal-binding protein [Vibrio taketomensis]
MSEIHAHKVLNLLREKPMTESDLRQSVIEEFGTEAQFRTCKLSGFDFEKLFAFFVERQKIIQQGDVWMVNQERVCGH